MGISIDEELRAWSLRAGYRFGVKWPYRSQLQVFGEGREECEPCSQSQVPIAVSSLRVTLGLGGSLSFRLFVNL